jgi:hypothetical protein
VFKCSFLHLVSGRAPGMETVGIEDHPGAVEELLYITYGEG